ncbi:hypothetical protein GCM10023195_48630 [Actinoallomurus liliacearum]|uniref:Thiamine pyrophosphate enzyme TPP-binding domain-containing protein n=1 Tax=Actinoallomurus liliacearum TaxID=1080073 RepID=A0ABP8TP37_9ACTN
MRRRGRYAGGTRFQSPTGFAAVARACHAHGEIVIDRADLVPTLRRAIEPLEAGRPAVVDVRLARN